MTAKMIPLAKIAKLRKLKRSHGLKTREEYEKAKEDFIATRNPGQTLQQTHAAYDQQTTKTRTTETMMDTSVKIFYGDYSRNDKDPTTWMQNLNTRKVANDWTDDKAVSIFESILAEDKKAYKWWHKDLKTMEPTMDRKDWAAVRRAFKERWLPLPEPEEDLESKREELEQMRLTDRDLGTKVTYQGQELYSHVAFANQATRLANEIGDTNAFLLPSIRNQLPEAIKNMLKSTGKRPKTWEEFRKVMTTIPLSDLREEAAEIAKRDNFYMEVAALRARTSGLTPAMVRSTVQPRPMLTPTPNRLPVPQTILADMPPPRYPNPPLTPRIPTQNRFPPNGNPQNSPTNPFQTTPNTNRAPFASPTIGTDTTPTGRAKESAGDPFANWDRRSPYPRTTEGKAAYETAIQAWWNRNGFNARATAADLIPLTPGTARTGTRDCYSCGRNDRGDARFPHSSEDCTITPKIPAQERSWRAFCGNQARAATITDQQNQGSIQQIEEYETHQEQAGPTNLNQGNGEEPTA